MRSTNNLPRDAVHVFVLCAFAVAQPLYDLLGRHATFFIAHDPEPAAVVWFALVLSLGLPGALVLVEAGAALISSRLRRALHLALIAALAALIALPPLNRSAALPDQLILATAALVGILAATAYARVSAVRSVCTVLAPSVLLFPGLFLFASQAAEVVRPDTAASGQRIAPSPRRPSS